jgi:methionyl-tRNA formyltransferase
MKPMTLLPKLFSRFFSSQKSASSKTQALRPDPSTFEIPKVRIVFMGTPELAASLLGTLIEKGYNIVGVVTKKDALVGRKKELKQSPVKEIALKHEIPVLQPEKLDPVAVQAIQELKPDLLFVAAYGKILPQTLLEFPGFGCINFHTSLLPKWRGASPIQNALLAGEKETGVTLMLMDKGMDTGDILAQTKVSIEPHDTTPLLTEKLLVAGTKLVLETLPQWIERRITPVKQDETQVTLCQLIEREDGHIFWTDDAESIYNRFRALSPWPGVFSYWKRGGNELIRLKLITLSYQKQNTQTIKPLGTVFEIGEKIGVQTTTGVVFLEVVQLEGKTPAPIEEFIRGYGDFIGGTLQ